MMWNLRATQRSAAPLSRARCCPVLSSTAEERQKGVRPQSGVCKEHIDGAVKEVWRDKSGNKHTQLGYLYCSSLYENNIVQACDTHACSHYSRQHVSEKQHQRGNKVVYLKRHIS